MFPSLILYCLLIIFQNRFVMTVKHFGVMVAGPIYLVMIMILMKVCGSFQTVGICIFLFIYLFFYLFIFFFACQGVILCLSDSYALFSPYGFVFLIVHSVFQLESAEIEEEEESEFEPEESEFEEEDDSEEFESEDEEFDEDELDSEIDEELSDEGEDWDALAREAHASDMRKRGRYGDDALPDSRSRKRRK
jgi:FACT complex subunit SPT16, C-terminal domain